MSLDCWKCLRPLEEIKKISFRTHCTHCYADQHVCVNCKFYTPGKPNDCAIPGTESIRDREAVNFCEDFFVKAKNSDPSSDKQDPFKKAKRILGFE